MAVDLESNYGTVIQDAFSQGKIMATAKQTILTKEEFKRLSLNTALPVDILEDKYRSYRNGYVLTANSTPGGWDK